MCWNVLVAWNIHQLKCLVVLEYLAMLECLDALEYSVVLEYLDVLVCSALLEYSVELEYSDVLKYELCIATLSCVGYSIAFE